MQSEESSEEEEKNRETFYCVACKEEIRPDAAVCPHCQASQQPESWKAFFKVVKYIGGITAVLTLLAMLYQAIIIVNAWHEKNEAVSEFVSSAKSQSKSGDYAGSWALVEKALAIDPESGEAKKYQVKLAMQWLREGRLGKEHQLQENMDKILPVLYRGAGVNNKKESADVLAHLGWANFLIKVNGLKDLDVDQNFKQALKKDPDNIYANVFSGYWLLDYRNKNEYPFDRFSEANRRFQTALNRGDNKAFVLDYQYVALRGGHLKTVPGLIQALKIAELAHQENITLSALTTFKMKEAISRILEHAENADQDKATKTYHALIEAGFDGHRLLNIFSMFKGYDPFKGNYYDDTNKRRYLSARLDEMQGELKKALAYHVQLWSSRDHCSFRNDIIFRIMKKQGQSFAELLCFQGLANEADADRNAQNAGVRFNDLLLKYAGKDITSYEQLSELISQHEKQEQIPLVVLRQVGALQYSMHEVQVKGGDLSASFYKVEIPSNQLKKFRADLQSMKIVD